MNTAAALRYVERARRSGYYVCPCGRRLRGHNLRWPKWRFKVTVYRECVKLGCAEAAHRHGDPVVHALEGGGATVRYPEVLGPYPPHTPVCPEHHLERLS